MRRRWRRRRRRRRIYTHIYIHIQTQTHMQGDGASPEEVQKKVMSHLGLRQLLDGMDELLVRVCNKFRYSVIKDENLRVALAARCLVDAELTVAVAGRSYRYFPRHLSNLFGSICKEEFDVLVGDRLEKNRKTWELQYGFELFEGVSTSIKLSQA